MIKVSVVMAAYNCEKYIDRAIASVLNQTLKEIELVVIDDGSTDRTAMMVDDWTGKDNRIRVLHKVNSGHGHSINLGIEMARGEYIANLDADDFMDPDMLDAYYNVAKVMEAEVVRGDYIQFSESGSKEETYCNCTGYRSLYYKVLNPQKLEEASLKCAHMIWTGIYKREFLNNYHIRCNEAYGATYDDNGFYFQVLCNCRRMVLANQAGCHYQSDTPGSSTSIANYLAMEREYGFIYSYIKTREEFHKFLPVYWYYYYVNNQFILWRIPEKIRKDYIKHIRALFLSAKKRGELQEFCFGMHDWDMVLTLIDSADEFEVKLHSRMRIEKSG